MKKLRAKVCAVTHSGRTRRENEDNYDLNGRLTSTGDLRKGSAFVQSMSEPFHLAVCDGMGGESYGELASGIAVETVAAHASNIYESGEDFSFAIANCIEDANSRICAEINARGKRMGTTLAAIYAVKGKIICVNIGDSRIYHYSKGILEQISFDHTHAQTIVDAGQVSQDNINQIPDAKRLTKHLGVFPGEANLSPNISVIDDVDNGDIVLLCSDGLTDMVDDGEITAILSTAESAQDAASKLIRRALENGGKDNVSVMAAFIEAEETAIFAPIAAAMVGDTDADYEEEYRNSYGSNQLPDEENPVSPYANADARAYVKPMDKAKIMKIAGIVAAAIAVIVIAALLIKALVGGKETDEDNITTGTTYDYYGYQTVYEPVTEPTTSFTVWSFESTSETESETSSTTQSTTRKKVTTTKRKTSSTTKKPSPTKKPTTTRKPTASSKPASTAAPSTAASTTASTTVSASSTVASTGTTESTAAQESTNTTAPSNTQPAQPESSTAHQTESTQQEQTQAENTPQQGA